MGTANLRDSFVYYRDYHYFMDIFLDDNYGKMARAVNEYIFLGVDPALTGDLLTLFNLFKERIDKDIK